MEKGQHKGGGYYCTYKDCRLSFHKKKPGIKFFRFPKDHRRCKEWLICCGRPDLIPQANSQKLYNNRRICSLHFEYDMYMGPAKNRLLPLATPKPITNTFLPLSQTSSHPNKMVSSSLQSTQVEIPAEDDTKTTPRPNFPAEPQISASSASRSPSKQNLEDTIRKLKEEKEQESTAILCGNFLTSKCSYGLHKEASVPLLQDVQGVSFTIPPNTSTRDHFGASQYIYYSHIVEEKEQGKKPFCTKQEANDSFEKSDLLPFEVIDIKEENEQFFVKVRGSCEEDDPLKIEAIDVMNDESSLPEEQLTVIKTETNRTSELKAKEYNNVSIQTNEAVCQELEYADKRDVGVQVTASWLSTL